MYPFGLLDLQSGPQQRVALLALCEVVPVGLDLQHFTGKIVSGFPADLPTCLQFNPGTKRRA
jgi:hypothetical protein